MSNCILTGNTAGMHGGGVSTIGGSSTIINCTFSANTAQKGGAVYSQGGTVSVINTILWENSASSGQEIETPYSTISVTYSDIKGGYTGTGNIDINPLFIGSGDYHLQIGSPCIDAGSPLFSFFNEPEPNGCRINMGAYGNTVEATASSDFDLDGLWCDNCPYAPNPDQTDGDGDGLGDACDGFYVTSQVAKNMFDSMPELIVLDVREQQSEFCDETGHIPGAVNYPWISGGLQDNYDDLPVDNEILVVCRSGHRSRQATEFLITQGYTNVYSMVGGMQSWQWETEQCNPDTIYGQVTGDLQGGVTVNLYQVNCGGESFVASMKTNPFGYYWFTDLPAQQYVVVPAYDGAQFDPQRYIVDIPVTYTYPYTTTHDFTSSMTPATEVTVLFTGDAMGEIEPCG